VARHVAKDRDIARHESVDAKVAALRKRGTLADKLRFVANSKKAVPPFLYPSFTKTWGNKHENDT
jgi:hypothetical protein